MQPFSIKAFPEVFLFHLREKQTAQCPLLSCRCYQSSSPYFVPSFRHVTLGLQIDQAGVTAGLELPL